MQLFPSTFLISVSSSLSLLVSGDPDCVFLSPQKGRCGPTTDVMSVEDVIPALAKWFHAEDCTQIIMHAPHMHKWNTLELYPNFNTSLFSVQELQWFGITECLSTLNHYRWGKRNFIIATQLSLLWHVTLPAALQNSLEVWGVLLSKNLLPSREKTVFCHMKDGTDVIKLKKIRQ